jgi:hypothetical protein
MKAGIALPQSYSHPAQFKAEFKAFAARAEEAGFDSSVG